MPIKILLRKTDISPADWRIEKYVLWEQQKNATTDEPEFLEDEN